MLLEGDAAARANAGASDNVQRVRILDKIHYNLDPQEDTLEIAISLNEGSTRRKSIFRSQEKQRCFSCPLQAAC